MNSPGKNIVRTGRLLLQEQTRLWNNEDDSKCKTFNEIEKNVKLVEA